MKSLLCMALAVFLGVVVSGQASPERGYTDELPMKIIHLQKPDAEEAESIIKKVIRTPKLAATPLQDVATPNNHGRILHGKPVTNITDFPYQVSMITSDGYFCGASLISTRWILTAAHCISKKDIWIFVFMGSECWAYAPGQFFIKRAIIHGGYNPEGLLDDIALLDIGFDIDLDIYEGRVFPLDPESEGCAPDGWAGENANVTGWGLTSESSTSIEECLWYVCTKIISNQECSGYYGSIYNSQLCTVNPKGLNGTLCSGDRGDPLVLKKTGRQVGINSFVSIYGCEAGWPSGYTRVPCYIDWIRAAQSS